MTGQTIEQQKARVKRLEKKLLKMGAMVPPPIRAEVYRHYAEECQKLEGMENLPVKEAQP